MPDIKPTVPVEQSPLPPVVRSFGLTHPGRVRPTNEDQFLIAELVRTLWVRQSSLPQPRAQHGRSRGHLFLVADGMGGHQAGEVASALTVSVVEAFVLNLLRKVVRLHADDEGAVLRELQDALRLADARLFAESAAHPQLAGMGTTATLALVSGWSLFTVHAGDSRCYLWRGGALTQRTRDHTVAAALLRQGVIGPEEARHHPHRHTLTNVLGGGEADVQAEVGRLDLESGDVLLLCSDGLTDMVSDERLAAILGEEPDPERAAERLVAEANERGGRDNITAVVARLDRE